MSTAAPFEPHGILFGAAYYAEYHAADRMEQDLDLMAEAGFTVIRVGESVWSTWEPRDGEFDLEWLAPVLDGAHRRGIRVVLGTPTYAVPPWLQRAHPEIAAEVATGRRVPWGGRQEVDFSHPTFRYYAERVIRRIVERYAQHPAVVGYQVDNEPGLHLFHNDHVFNGFVRELQHRYGDVETLNREWGLVYWSHRIADWSELWRPDGNTLPQYDLAWRRYLAGLTTEFIAWQAGIVREYATPEQFVTTCLAFTRPALDDEKLTQSLDITAGNPYYAMQDHLAADSDHRALTPWTTSGVAGLYRQADRLFSSRQSRFFVTETDAQTIGGSSTNLPPWPGQLKQAAFALISRGAAMIEYWHWHTIPYGTETYWGGVLPHSLVPGRVYREVAEIGAALGAIGGALDGFEPDADVALLWSNESKWAFEFFPPLEHDGTPDRASYEQIFDAFHRGVVESGRQARIVHVDQAAALGAAELADRFPVLVAPALYVARDDDLDLLRDYASAGGHLVIGIRTGYADHEARARVAVAPDRLHEAAGASYDEYSNIAASIPVVPTHELRLPESSAGQAWVDGLVAHDAETLASYQHPRFKDFAAITTRRSDAGRITVVGTVPSPALARRIFEWAAPDAIADALLPDRALPLTVASGLLPDGRRAWFVTNWSWSAATATTARATLDAEHGAKLPARSALTLEPWAVRVLIDEAP